MSLSDAIQANYEQLNTNGYLLIRDGLSKTPQKEIETAREAVENDDYVTIFGFMKSRVFPVLESHLGWTSPIIGLTHMSDNDNPTTFHRDLFAVFNTESEVPNLLVNKLNKYKQDRNTSKKEQFPTLLYKHSNISQQLTLVIYLDETEVSVIEGTHLLTRVNPLDAVSMYFTKYRRNFVNCGDIIVFYSHLIHKGAYYPNFNIFDSNRKIHRRVIQSFDVYPNRFESDFEMAHVEMSGMQLKENKSEEEEAKLENMRQKRVLILKIVLGLPLITGILQFFFFLWMIFQLHEYQLLNLLRERKEVKKNKENKEIVIAWRRYGSFHYRCIDDFGDELELNQTKT